MGSCSDDTFVEYSKSPMAKIPGLFGWPRDYGMDGTRERGQRGTVIAALQRMWVVEIEETWSLKCEVTWNIFCCPNDWEINF